MKISEYCAEIMKQTFDDTIGHDFIKLGFIFYLRKKRYVFSSEPVDEMFLFAYRFLIDNKEITQNTSNVLLKNIEKYSPDDFREQFIQELKEWVNVGEGVLLFDGITVSINPALELSDNEKETLDQVIMLICQKNIGKTISYDDSLNAEAEAIRPYIFDFCLYINKMQDTRFRNRAFETLDYCPCCEEINRQDLVAIHLCLDGDLSDPDNLIVLCKEHAELYFNGFFKFSKMGKIIIKKSSQLLDARMHISSRLLTKHKKQYLE